MALKPPKYTLHKPSWHARVRINGKDIYLGEFNSPEFIEEYNRVIARFHLGKLDVDRDSLSIARLAVMYVEFARGYYLKDGRQTSEVHGIQLALTSLLIVCYERPTHVQWLVFGGWPLFVQSTATPQARGP